MDYVTPKDLFIKSLDRCKENENFASSFYDRFLSTSDEIRHLFRNTNFEIQEKMLLQSLSLAAEATAGEPEALEHLSERARTHNRDHLNIEPRHYDIWLSTVITTAKAFDMEWNSDIEKAWLTILGYVIKRMVSKY
ncbi:MAG: globin domain-containing protein [Pseudomonadales bacterium]